MTLLWILFAVALGTAHSHVEFEHVNVPATNVKKHAIVSSLRATFGSLEEQGNSFNKIARTGEDHNCRGSCRLLVGSLANNASRYIVEYDPDTLEFIRNETSTLIDPRLRAISHSPSGASMIKAIGSPLWYMIFHFSDPQPGVIYQLELRLENETALASREIEVVSFSRYGGVWKPAGATVAPWDGTHLGTEGSPPDARVLEEAECLHDPDRDCLSNTHPTLFKDVLDYLRYWRRYPVALREEGVLSGTFEGIRKYFNPYAYGYPFSVRVTNAGRSISEKLYAVGRVGAESVIVMPDYKTLYLSGQSGGLYKFVARRPSDLSQGTLYAAKIFIRKASVVDASAASIENVMDSEFSMEWITLGSMTGNLEIEEVRFSALFETENPENGKCPSLRLIVHDGRIECLAIKQGQETLAASLEPERVASLKSSTTSVFKFAGMATRHSTSILIAARSIEEGILEAVIPGVESEAAIFSKRIAQNECGCLFEISLDEDFNANEMIPVTCGSPTQTESNTCSTESLADPRTVTHVEPFGRAFIGEDSSRHENNAGWTLDDENQRLTRVFTAPIKGGIRGLNWFQDVVGGNNYISINVAHPNDTFGWLGYFGAFEIKDLDVAISPVPVPYASGPKGIPQSYRRLTQGVTETIPEFSEVFRSRDNIVLAGVDKTSTETFTIGEALDRQGKPIDRYEEIRGDPAKFSRQNGETDLSDTLAFSSIVNMCGRRFAVTSSGTLPAVSYTMLLSDELKPSVGSVIDWSEYGGLWRPAGGQISPWNTVLGGESFEPDAQHLERPTCLTGSFSCLKARSPGTYDTIFPFIRYFEKYIDDLDNSMGELKKVFKPYMYGYATEIKINQYMCSTARKWLTLGRFSHGSLQVMPDQKTVYMTDWTAGNGIGGGFFKFVAVRRTDLSAGTLYAAKFNAQSSEGATFDIEWIELGTATNSELLEAAKTTTFNDIFDYTLFGSRHACPDDRRPVNIKSTPECLAVKPGMERLAAFFETRRYAAYLGATTEWGNLRGIVYDAASRHLFVSVARIAADDDIMLQNVKGSPNHVNLGLARCGCLFRLAVDEQTFDVGDLKPHVCGRGDIGIDGENMCNLELVSNPGDLSIIPGQNKLLIAEDSCEKAPELPTKCGHINNAIWTLNPFDRSDITRLLTSPYISRVSAIQYSWDIENGGGMIQTVVNEPYDGGDDARAFERESSGPMAWFGYIGPFKNPLRKTEARPLGATMPVCYNKRDESDYSCPGGEFDFVPPPPPGPNSPPAPPPPFSPPRPPPGPPLPPPSPPSPPSPLSPPPTPVRDNTRTNVLIGPTETSEISRKERDSDAPSRQPSEGNQKLPDPVQESSSQLLSIPFSFVVILGAVIISRVFHR